MSYPYSQINVVYNKVLFPLYWTFGSQAIVDVSLILSLFLIHELKLNTHPYEICSTKPDLIDSFSEIIKHISILFLIITAHLFSATGVI